MRKVLHGSVRVKHRIIMLCGSLSYLANIEVLIVNPSCPVNIQQKGKRHAPYSGKTQPPGPHQAVVPSVYGHQALIHFDDKA